MSALVLIADEDADRAGRIAEACAVRGFVAKRVPNGAEALDAALTHVPDALVASGALELIAPWRLTEILRANPRTQGIQLVFLGPPAGQEAGEAGGVHALASDAAPEEIVRRVEELVVRSARLEATEGRAGADQEVHGRLSQIGLSDLLQLFHMNRRTGTISLRRRTADGREDRGRVHLRDGEVVQAVTGAVEGEKALLRLLAWSDGSFVFRPEPIQLMPRIRTATRALLMEAMRQLDEWRALGARLPSLDAEVTLRVRSAELPSVVHPVTQEVLLLLEICTRVRDVVDRCSFPDYQVLRTLQTLAERGIVAFRKGPPPATPDPSLFSRAQIRRLREWFAPAAGMAAPLRDAKLLIASADVAATRDFLGLLARLPGMALEPRFTKHPLRAADLARVGRLRVDAEVGIEWLHVPCAPRFAPLWPLAGHGALATLLLLPGPASEAAQTLRPLTETLRTLPRARLLPLLLGRAGETSLPDEVRESLSLFDDSSLLFLPLEGEPEPAARLRSMLARILP